MSKLYTFLTSTFTISNLGILCICKHSSIVKTFIAIGMLYKDCQNILTIKHFHNNYAIWSTGICTPPLELAMFFQLCAEEPDVVVFLNQWNGGKEGKRRLEERKSRIQRERERGERKKKKERGQQILERWEQKEFRSKEITTV